MAALSEIISKTWGISISNFGIIAEGLASIRQCIDVIIRTTKGTDPLRPEFGSEIYKYADRPVSIAIPNIKKSIIDAIEKWEKRVRITSITHTLDISQIIFNIGYVLIDQDVIDELLLTVKDGVVTTGKTNDLIVQGLFPYNPKHFRYFANLQIDGVNALPQPPKYGFASPEDMYAWISSNWSGYATWHLLADRVVGYMRKGVYKSASISISLIDINRIARVLEPLGRGQKYQVEVGLYTLLGDNITTELFATEGAVLQYLKTNMSNYGEWDIESIDGDFNDDLNLDYQLFQRVLVLYTKIKAERVILNVTIV